MSTYHRCSSWQWEVCRSPCQASLSVVALPLPRPLSNHAHWWRPGSECHLYRPCSCCLPLLPEIWCYLVDISFIFNINILCHWHYWSLSLVIIINTYFILAIIYLESKTISNVIVPANIGTKTKIFFPLVITICFGKTQHLHRIFVTKI